MSCHCNKCVQLCNPCEPICPPQYNPCLIFLAEESSYNPQSNSYNSQCNHCGSWDNRRCGCNNNRRYDDCDDHRSNKYKRCNKCYRRECDCVEYYPCLRTKCGFISATLTKTANPTFYTAAGQIITYSYTITNTGSAPIYYPIQICDDKLGGQRVPPAYISPGSSQVVTRTYTISPADLADRSITNTAVAYIQVKRCKWVFTQPAAGQIGASATITFGSADLSGTLTQTLNNAATAVTVLVTINNSASSPTSAFGVNLILPFPAGITSPNVLAGGSIGGAAVPVVGTNGVTISQDTIAPGVTNQYSFTYSPVTRGAAYTWSGTITSASFDPNPNNNNVINTFVVPLPA